MHHLIISNGEMAMEVLKVHDAEFASRPIVIAEKYLGLNWSTITFSHYGDHWRLLHKIIATQLLQQQGSTILNLGVKKSWDAWWKALLNTTKEWNLWMWGKFVMN